MYRYVYCIVVFFCLFFCPHSQDYSLFLFEVVRSEIVILFLKPWFWTQMVSAILEREKDINLQNKKILSHYFGENQ